MSAIEQMKVEISRKAKEEAERIIEKARSEAEAIIERAYKESKDAEERDRRKLSPELRRVRSEIIGAAVAGGRRRILEIKEALISEVFDMAEDEVAKLANGGGERYEELLIRLIMEGVRSIREQKIRLMCNRRDSEFIRGHINMIRESLRGNLGWNVEVDLADDTLECIGGAIISNMDGRIIYHNTLQARFVTMREKLRLNVANLLFGE